MKKFYWDCKNLDDQTSPGRPKNVDPEVVLQAIEVNPVSSSWRVSGKLGISQSSMIHHFHNLGKSIWNCRIVPHIIKILQNFWLTLVISEQIKWFFHVYLPIFFFKSGWQSYKVRKKYLLMFLCTCLEYYQRWHKKKFFSHHLVCIFFLSTVFPSLWCIQLNKYLA